MTDTATAQSVDADPDADPDASASGAESEVSGRVGSTGALDRTDEDFTREGARATGYMGKNSEVTWIQRLKQENRYGDSSPTDVDTGTYNAYNDSVDSLRAIRTSGNQSVPLAEAADGFSIHESSYHLDDLAISTFEAIDPYEMPTSDTAETLFNIYMQRVHPTLPVVGQVNLLAQFKRFLANPTQRPPDKWLAIVNMIFAISAKYSHLIQAEWKGDERDHIIYFNRARMLVVDHEILFIHPDLQTIQIMCLMAFYLMCISQMNR